MTQEDFSAVCPYLGLADDADSHATYATEAHRCYRLPNPTRIAPPHQETYCLGANHVTCPVYLGEGVSKTVPAAGAAAAGAAAGAAGVAATRGAEERPTVRGPQAGQRPAGRGPFEQSSTARPQRRQSPGALSPRPRAGGVSMPVATIGLFALAIVVIALAFAINSIVGGGGDDNKLSPSDVTGTQVALKATQTAKAGGGQQTQPAQQTTTTSPAASQTAGTRPAGTGTPGAGSTTTPGGGAATYTVKAGDLCSTIASNNGITLQQLLQANNMTEDDCTRLQVGQVLKLR